MYIPTPCRVEGCNATLPLVQMFAHQDAHLADFNQQGAHSLDDSEDPQDQLAVVSPSGSSETRSDQISLLNRRWSMMTARSRRRGTRGSETGENTAYSTPASTLNASLNNLHAVTGSTIQTSRSHPTGQTPVPSDRRPVVSEDRRNRDLPSLPDDQTTEAEQEMRHFPFTGSSSSLLIVFC